MISVLLRKLYESTAYANCRDGGTCLMNHAKVSAVYLQMAWICTIAKDAAGRRGSVGPRQLLRIGV